ncbi:small nuclear ribonucleoprotein E-like [Protopterus annectens]|uniref:small nuclear ribonucleoprotein E-like n=1 Tax=Protopterus annectens TaxID=7888 RepID=UPI001CFA1D70|nr:small nuclear ribonucleoprotein E-like [Protopterus annectens]
MYCISRIEEKPVEQETSDHLPFEAFRRKPVQMFLVGVAQQTNSGFRITRKLHIHSCFFFFPPLQRSRIQVWLYEQVNMRIEGCIIGFDEYMNLVLDDAEEIHMKSKARKPLGRIMLKGDNITLLQSVSG